MGCNEQSKDPRPAGILDRGTLVVIMRILSLVRGSIPTQTATLNVKLTFVGVWLKMPDVRIVAEMTKTNFQNIMCNNSNTK